MTFELWDLTTRNITGFFESKEAALAAVRTAVKEHGREYAEPLLLVSEDSRGRSRTVAEGGELVDLAFRAAAVSKPHASDKRAQRTVRVE